MASSRDWHGGKGSVRRPGTAYEKNYEAIFGNKAKETKPEPTLNADTERFIMRMVASMLVIYVLAIAVLAII